jgi:hypothetical protein
MTCMFELRKIDVLSMAKIYGVIAAIAGFVVGIIVAFMSLFFGSLAAAAGQVPVFPFAGVIGAVAIIVLPIVYGIVGFILGAVSAFLYNIIAARIGGIHIDLGGGPPKAAAPQKQKGR